MADDTQILLNPSAHKKEDHIAVSHFMGISIRAWLALGLIGAVILHSVAIVVTSVYLSTRGVITIDQAINALKITEPLYTMSGMALAYYFGQQKQQTNKT